ncbi:hypothetical protein ND748_31935, partial [Frankia sp. AiPs1]
MLPSADGVLPPRDDAGLRTRSTGAPDGLEVFDDTHTEGTVAPRPELSGPELTGPELAGPETAGQERSAPAARPAARRPAVPPPGEGGQRPSPG